MSSAFFFASALTAELWALPDFPGPWAWGCDGGGAVEVDDDFALTFDACVFFAGLRIDGVGAYDPDAETLRWQARVHGPHTGTLTYTEDPEAEGAATLTGTWDGQAVGP